MEPLRMDKHTTVPLMTEQPLDFSIKKPRRVTSSISPTPIALNDPSTVYPAKIEMNKIQHFNNSAYDMLRSRPQSAEIPHHQDVITSLLVAQSYSSPPGHLQVRTRQNFASDSDCSLSSNPSSEEINALPSPSLNQEPNLLKLEFSDLKVQAEEFENYKRQLQNPLQETTTKSNANMRRIPNTNAEKLNDPEYLEKRRKNNEAAKRSRDARKEKEKEQQLRCGFYEKKLFEAQRELELMKAELERANAKNRQINNVLYNYLRLNPNAIGLPFSPFNP